MPESEPFRILVICTGNRARSQMAHGWLSHLGGDRVRVWSAGTQPKGVHPMAIQAMAEVGIDISGHTSDHVDSYVGERFDLVVTVCDSAREICPFSRAGQADSPRLRGPGPPWRRRRRVDVGFRRVRDEIGEFSRSLLADEVAGPQ